MLRRKRTSGMGFKEQRRDSNKTISVCSMLEYDVGPSKEQGMSAKSLPVVVVADNYYKILQNVPTKDY